MSPPDEDVVATEVEPEPPQDGEAPAPETAATPDTVDRVSRPAFVLAVSLAALFALVAAVLGVLAARAGGDEALDEVRDVAGRFGEVAFTYDYRDPDDNEERVSALATPRFQEEYARAFSGLRDLVEEVQSTSRASVNDVYVAEVDGSTALAVVSVNLDLDGPAGPRTYFDVYVRVSLQRLDGEWKVDDMAAITTPTGGSDADTSTTATSAPATSETSEVPTTPVP